MTEDRKTHPSQEQQAQDMADLRRTHGCFAPGLSPEARLERERKGARLNELRATAWVTTHELGRRVGVSPLLLREIEFGMAELPPELEAKILAALGIGRI